MSVCVDLRGVIDVETELARLRKEVDRINPQAEQYRRKMSEVGYESKVPENVRALNSEKLRAYDAELAATYDAIEAFMKLRPSPAAAE